MNRQLKIARLLLLGALVTPVISSFAQQITVQKGLSRETVKLNVTTTTPFALGRESVAMVFNRLTVTMRSFDNVPDAGPSPPAADVAATTADVILGDLPEGSYSAEVLFLDRRTRATTSLGTVQFTIGEDPAALLSGYPAYDFTDLWWNASESGWGISFHARRERFFAAWFVYDSTGKPTWYTLQLGRWEAPNKYTGRIYATRADPNGGVGPMGALAVTEVGNGTLTFNGKDRAVFDFTVEGTRNTKNIERQPF